MQGSGDILSNYLIGIAVFFTQLILIYITKIIRNYIYSHKRSFRSSGTIHNHKVLLLSRIFLVSFIGIVSAIYFYASLSRIGIISLLVITFSIIIILLLHNLNRFWSIGLNYIEPSIAKDTYSKAFNTASDSFILLGTNAYSFSKLKEFEDMLKRLRQSRGNIELLLVHPDSKGLEEAAENRNCQKNLYQNQARYSLGYILNLKKTLGINLTIKLFVANGIEELPIFRSMFLDSKHCIASIAVYGRDDHGRSLPQIFAQNNTGKTNIPKSMYSIVYRYYKGLYDLADEISENGEKELIAYWENSLLEVDK